MRPFVSAAVLQFQVGTPSPAVCDSLLVVEVFSDLEYFSVLCKFFS